MKILVFDFGGGTLDVTIMEMGGGVFEVMSTSGDTQLGGTDMDKVIIDYVVDNFRKNRELIFLKIVQLWLELEKLQKKQRLNFLQ